VYLMNKEAYRTTKIGVILENRHALVKDLTHQNHRDVAYESRMFHLSADSGEIGHLSAPNRPLVRPNRPPCEKGSGSGAGMAIV